MTYTTNPQVEALIDAAWLDFRAQGANRAAFGEVVVRCAIGGEPVERRILEAAVKMRDALGLIRDSEPAGSSARRIAEVVIAEVNVTPAERRAKDDKHA